MARLSREHRADLVKMGEIAGGYQQQINALQFQLARARDLYQSCDLERGRLIAERDRVKEERCALELRFEAERVGRVEAWAFLNELDERIRLFLDARRALTPMEDRE